MAPASIGMCRAGIPTNAKGAMKITLAVSALVLCLALATTAFGQSSVQGYNNQAGQIQAQVESGGDEDTTQPVATTQAGGGGGGSLPFTGLDVALLVGAGGMLVAVGFAMRRLTRAPGSA
jgi:hypothetical protein